MINETGQVPIQDSNAILYSEDEKQLPTWLQYPYEIVIGKGWSAILFEEENYQGEWEYIKPGETYHNPFPVRSLRVYYLVCPLPPDSASDILFDAISSPYTSNYPDCTINPPTSLFIVACSFILDKAPIDLFMPLLFFLFLVIF